MALSSSYRISVMAIANIPVTVSHGGIRRALTLFDVMVRRLALGQTSRRHSTMPFIEMVIACAGQYPDERSVPEDMLSPTDDQDVLAARGRLDQALAFGDGANINRAIADVMAALRASTRLHQN